MDEAQDIRASGDRQLASAQLLRESRVRHRAIVFPEIGDVGLAPVRPAAKSVLVVVGAVKAEMFGAPFDRVARSSESRSQWREAAAVRVGLAKKRVLFRQPRPPPASCVARSAYLRTEAGLGSAWKSLASEDIDHLGVEETRFEQFDGAADLLVGPSIGIVWMAQSEFRSAGRGSADRSSDDGGDARDVYRFLVTCAELGVFPSGPLRRIGFGEIQILRACVDRAAAAAEVAGDRSGGVDPVTTGKFGVVEGCPFANGVPPQAELVDLGANGVQLPVEVLSDVRDGGIIGKHSCEIGQFSRRPGVLPEGHFAKRPSLLPTRLRHVARELDDVEFVRRVRQDRHGRSSA